MWAPRKSHRPAARRVAVVRRGVPLALAAALLLTARPPCLAQATWDVTPYRVRLWVGMAAAPSLPADWQQELRPQLVAQLQAAVGPIWQLKAEAAPAGLASDIAHQIERVTIEDVQRSLTDLDQGDKLILVGVRSEADGYVVAARQLDCRTRVWNHPVQLDVCQSERLIDDLAWAVVRVFTPVALVHQVEDRTVTLRLRAGLLVGDGPSPALPGPGTVFQPVLRHIDRTGNPRPGGVQPVAWTLLEPRARSGSTLVCDLHSGYQQPLSARRNRRVEQLAVALQPLDQPTRLLLRRRGPAPRPLVGYEVFARSPDNAGTQLLGQSDLRGEVLVPPDDQPLRLLYIKHGGQLLARLPLVPGAQPEAVVELSDDDLRLEAEGFLKGFQEGLLDLVARRELLAARVRLRITAGRLDEAQQLLDQLRRLETRDDLLRLLDRRRQTLEEADPSAKKRLDSLFEQTRQLVGTYLDPELIQRLQSELAAARAAPASPPAESATSPAERAAPAAPPAGTAAEPGEPAAPPAEPAAEPAPA